MHCLDQAAYGWEAEAGAGFPEGDLALAMAPALLACHPAPPSQCLTQPVSPHPHLQKTPPSPHLRPGLLPTIHALGLLLIQHEPILVTEFRHLLPLVVHSLHGWIVGDDVFQGLPLGNSQRLIPTSSSSRRLSHCLLSVEIYPSLSRYQRGTWTNPPKLSALFWEPEGVLQQEGLGANTGASP